MKRADFEKYLGKKVRIRIFNGQIFEGTLHKTGKEMFKDKPKYYFVINSRGVCSYLFRVSHVCKVERVS